jgi:hypothetical protein
LGGYDALVTSTPDDRRSHLRASDAERDATAEVLREALAAGRLTADEHAERIDAVYQARTVGDLEPLVHDLPVSAAASGTELAPRGGIGASVDTRSASDESDTLVGIFGGSERRGRWRVRRRTKLVAVFGGHDLDMSEAVFEAPVVEVHAFVIFGGFGIRVPPNVTVENKAVGIFGGFGGNAISQAGEPGGPKLVVKGFALFGGGGIDQSK